MKDFWKTIGLPPIWQDIIFEQPKLPSQEENKPKQENRTTKKTTKKEKPL